MENDNFDVGQNADFSFFLKNAVALENHAEDAFKVTKNPLQKETKERVRQIRSKWMYRFVKNVKGEPIYCQSKHTEACSMGLSELASRFHEQGKMEWSEEALEDSLFFESLFMILNDFDKENNIKKEGFFDRIKNKFNQEVKDV